MLAYMVDFYWYILLARLVKSTGHIVCSEGGQKKSRTTGCFCHPAHRGGGYLLSHFRSTIGVVRFNFSVRNGKRWNPHAIATLVRFVRLSCQLSVQRHVCCTLGFFLQAL